MTDKFKVCKSQILSYKPNTNSVYGILYDKYIEQYCGVAECEIGLIPGRVSEGVCYYG